MFDAADYTPRGFGPAASWLATHEAAHAVVARAVGANVTQVQIDPARASGACHYALEHHLQAEQAAVRLAAYVAERELLGTPEQLARQRAAQDLADAHAAVTAGTGARDVLDRATEMVRLALADNAHALADLARALDRHHTVEGEALDRHLCRVAVLFGPTARPRQHAVIAGELLPIAHLQHRRP